MTHAEMLASAIVKMLSLRNREALPGWASTWVLKAAAMSSRHRSAVESFMVESEGASVCVPWRFLNWPRPLCPLAALDMLPAFYRAQRAWVGSWLRNNEVRLWMCWVDTISRGWFPNMERRKLWCFYCLLRLCEAKVEGHVAMPNRL